MNDLEIQVELAGEDFNLDLLIDGKSLLDRVADALMIDPLILFSGVSHGVSGYLVNCGCGDTGCGGIYSECAFIHQESRVVLAIPNPLDTHAAGDVPEGSTMELYYFDMDQFIDQCRKAAKFILQKVNEHEGLHIGPHY